MSLLKKVGQFAYQKLTLPGRLGIGVKAKTGLKDVADEAYNLTPAEHAHKRDIEMWNRQNEYNHPRAQMERLREAGLNPNLMYGQGQQTSSGSSRQMPQYNAQAALMEQTPLLNIITNLSEFAKTNATARKFHEEGVFLKDTQFDRQRNEFWKRVQQRYDASNAEKVMQLNYERWNNEIKKGRHLEELIETEGKRQGLLVQDIRWKKKENDVREQYNMNMSDAWKLRIIINALEEMGIDPENIGAKGIFDLFKRIVDERTRVGF